MKTLEAFIKEEKHYDDAQNFLPDEQVIPVFNVRAMLERYAAHVWEEAIAAQKVKCAEEAKINSKQHPDWDGWGIMPIISEIDKDSILNAPDAVNPFKK